MKIKTKTILIHNLIVIENTYTKIRHKTMTVGNKTPVNTEVEMTTASVRNDDSTLHGATVLVCGTKDKNTSINSK